MDNWKELLFDDVKEDNLIGLVRNTKQQSYEFDLDYLKMNNITNDGQLDLSSIVKVNASQDEIEKYALKRGDFLFNTRNSVELVGKTAVYDIDSTKPLLYNNNIMRTRFKSKYDPYFINYQFQSSDFQERLEKIKSGTTNVAAIYYKSLRDIKLKFPPLQEQQRIVAKLDGLFAKIDEAIGLLEENIKHTQALMGSVLDEEFGCSKHKSKPINELVLRTKTLNPKTEYLQEEFTYIDISSINKDIFQIENPKTLLGNDAPSRARKVVEKGDIVFATTRPNLKNIAIVSEDYNNPIASTGFCLLRTKKDLINNEYLFYFLISEKLQDYIQPFIRGAQYPAISDKDLLSIEVPFLPIEDQKNTVNRIKSVFDVSSSFIETQNQKLNHLKAIKSSLLDQAFKGEL